MRFLLRFWFVGTVALAVMLNSCAVAHAQRTTIFSENFDGLEPLLEDAVDEGTNQGIFEEMVWTHQPPAGWEIENDLPGIDEDGIGVTEWKGWSFANKDWWALTAGDQRRSEFTLGENVVAIADPDEWDDLGSPKNFGLYNTWLKTAPISLAGVKDKSLELNFVSSWRPEAFDDVDNLNNQTARITVSFDGGPEQEVMLWDSDGASDFYHDHFPDEEVNVTIDNPAGAKSMVVNFALLTAYNDWWWAIDDIQLTGVRSSTPGDFNGDGQLDTTDIDALTAEAAGGKNPAAYDLNGDAKVDVADIQKWVRDLKKSWIGDANLDGEFNSGDLVVLFSAGTYENAAAASKWSTGDFDGDGLFTTSDLVAALTDGGYEQGTRASVASVPEPSSFVLMLLGFGLLRRRR